MPPKTTASFGAATANPQMERFDYTYEYEYAMLDNNANDLPQVETRRIPDDQVKGLNDEQLNEVFTRVLTAADPKTSKTTVKYQFKDGVYKPDQTISHLAVHFSMDGNYIHVDSADAKEMDQVASTKAALEKQQGGKDNMKPLKNQFNYTTRSLQYHGNVMRDLSIATEPPNTTEHMGMASQWSIFHAYLKDYNEQLLQRNQAPKSSKDEHKDGISTNGGASEGKSPEANPTNIVNDDEEGKDVAVIAANEALKNAGKKTTIDPQIDPVSSLAVTSQDAESDLNKIFFSSRMSRALKVVERSLVANWDNDTYRTLKYVDDMTPCQPTPGGIAATIVSATASSNANDGNSNPNNTTTPADLGVLSNDVRGRVTPLWKLHNEDITGKQSVTTLAWHPQHHDLCAIGYGSHDFTLSHKLTKGYLLCYSLKNPTFPECSYTLPSPITALAWHPTLTSILAVGMYNGSVAIIDASRSNNTPLYIVTEPKTKHSGPVWQVQWPFPQLKSNLPKEDVPKAMGHKEETSQERLMFYSISSDGCVCEWTAIQHLLWRSDITQLTVTSHKNALCLHNKEYSGDTSGSGAGAGSEMDEFNTGDVQSTLITKYAGTCFSLHPTLPIFTVGTEEGHVYSMELALGAAIVQTYAGHHLPVYRINWNNLHPNLFVSCSADWTVKVWEMSAFAPVLTLDLGAPVADVAWSNSHASLLWCVSSDGWARAFNFTLSQKDPVSEIRISRSSRLTQMSVCSDAALLLIGDDKGNATVAKVSAKVNGNPNPENEDIDKEQLLLSNCLVTRDAKGLAKTINLIPPRYRKAPKVELVPLKVDGSSTDDKESKEDE